jgi:hypothetical protein
MFRRIFRNSAEIVHSTQVRLHYDQQYQVLADHYRSIKRGTPSPSIVTEILLELRSPVQETLVSQPTKEVSQNYS